MTECGIWKEFQHVPIVLLCWSSCHSVVFNMGIKNSVQCAALEQPELFSPCKSVFLLLLWLRPQCAVRTSPNLSHYNCKSEIRHFSLVRFLSQRLSLFLSLLHFLWRCTAALCIGRIFLSFIDWTFKRGGESKGDGGRWREWGRWV